LVIFFFAFKSHPGYFGKVGMRTYRVLKNRQWRPALNVDKLWSLVTEQHREVYQKKTDVAPVIDVVRAVSDHLKKNALH
jgi:large subunit ribosomal protein L27Ae